ncbi:MAG: recombination mediator RecR [Gammaproteobacteria bacterium]|nr:recombination mediator RecR [Gammaproteobacteria bacterium]
MSDAPLLDGLIEALRCLPGVGPKSAQRIAYHLLERDRDGARRLAASMTEAMDRIGHCRDCRTFTEEEVCRLCASPRRDASKLCVVETPLDMNAIAESTDYDGRFFVLLGRLSPLDGIGPAELGLDLLEERLASGTVAELILATGTTMEGEATAHYIADRGRAAGVPITRIAYGVPLGGELEYVDRGTLSHAFGARRAI